MNTFIDRQYEFNLWANSEIIKLCASLDETQLSVEIAGTFGNIRSTIAHMIQSEGNYVTDLGGEPLWPDDLDWNSIPLAELLDMAKQSGTALRQIANSIDPNKLCEYTEEGKRNVFPAWTVINQAINHGIEHRTQLRLLLTKLNVPHPGQSVWGYAHSINEYKIFDVSDD